MDQEVAEARKRLAERYGAPTQIGGKGKSAHSPLQVIEGTSYLVIRYSKKNQEGRHHSDCRRGQEAQSYRQKVR